MSCGKNNCRCAKCCGNIVAASVPLAAIGYTDRCKEFCRPGEHNQSLYAISYKQTENVNEILLSETYDFLCTNSKLWGTISLDVELDLSCDGGTITRDIIEMDAATTIPASFQFTSTPLMCHRGMVEFDAVLTLDTNRETQTINADYINILDENFVDGSIPLLLTATPEFTGTTLQIDIDLDIAMAI